MATSSSRMSASSAPIISRRPNTDTLFRWFRDAAEECGRCIDAKLPLPAYDQAIKASHIFNLLQARGVISVAERQAYIGRVRDLAKGACAGLDGEERVGGVSEQVIPASPARAGRGAHA